jgi:pimeloyl-ACP methyl ester carboxylesterase
MAPIKVTFHPLPTTHAFCHSSNAARSAVVFLHGLTAGPLRSPFATALAGKLPEGYALWEPHMRSSFTGFGFSSLANDVADIAELVTYLRGLEVDRIVLLGASTGTRRVGSYCARLSFEADATHHDQDARTLWNTSLATTKCRRSTGTS